MLFEHRVAAEWKDIIPAVIHVDGTARLQTISEDCSETAASRILKEYRKLSGVPVLCNTSANDYGKGFFADADAAANWGQTSYVWANSTL
jgi:carbamoyltransferase